MRYFGPHIESSLLPISKISDGCRKEVGYAVIESYAGWSGFKMSYYHQAPEFNHKLYGTLYLDYDSNSYKWIRNNGIYSGCSFLNIVDAAQQIYHFMNCLSNTRI